jgi:hypothetical protein
MVARLGYVSPRSLYILAMASCQQWCHNVCRCFGGGVLPAVVSASAPKHFLVWELVPFPPCFLTMRAADKWDAARFRSISLALSFSDISGRIHTRPLAANAGRWAVPCKTSQSELQITIPNQYEVIKSQSVFLGRNKLWMKSEKRFL